MHNVERFARIYFNVVRTNIPIGTLAYLHYLNL
jgi:hypothetical protein